MPMFQNDCSTSPAPYTMYAPGWTNQTRKKKIGGFLQCMKTKRLDGIKYERHFTVAVPKLSQIVVVASPHCRFVAGYCCRPLPPPSSCFHLCVTVFCESNGRESYMAVRLFIVSTCRNQRSEKDLCCNIQNASTLIAVHNRQITTFATATFSNDFSSRSFSCLDVSLSIGWPLRSRYEFFLFGCAAVFILLWISCAGIFGWNRIFNWNWTENTACHTWNELAEW